MPDLNILAAIQCFPFYTYDEDGSKRQENITNWGLHQFQAHYKMPSITKWDVFHYIYALLHHPEYKARYAKHLVQELPRIPFLKDFKDFKKFVDAGDKLMELHVNFESKEESNLKLVETGNSYESKKDFWKVKKMQFNKDKSAIQYNGFLTLEGIPAEAHEYKLENKSALEWLVNQYQVKHDNASGHDDDPNDPNENKKIISLIKKVTEISVKTVEIVKSLPPLTLNG